MSIFNITDLELASTFESWYVKNNEMIDAINQIALVDVQAGASQGLYETFRGGGVVILGISAGTAIGFDVDGALTLKDTGESTKTRTAQTDKFIVLNSSGNPQFVDSVNLLPSQVDQDVVFTGDVSFAGDLSFLSSGVLTFEAESAFRDKVLELAVKFEDRLEFATASDPLPTAGITGYLYDNDSSSAFNNADPNTYIGVGRVQGATDGINTNFHITVENFTFTENQQFFREFTSQGATAGGRYSLLDNSGGTLGRGFISYLGIAATVGDQTAPIDADRAGLAVVTNDAFAYDGGTAGQKLFIWRYNGSSVASAWTSSENIEVNSIRSLIAGNLTSQNDRLTMFPSSGNNFTLNLGVTVGSDSGLGLQYLGGSTNALSLGVLDSGVFTSALKLRDDLTFEAGTTGVALNLNADLLDGAQGATRGGIANTVPITDLDGKIHPSFIDGAEQVDEIITQTGHGFSRGHVLYQRSDGLYDLASANDASADAAEAVGVVSRIIDANTFVLTYFGIIGINGFSVGLGWSVDGITSGLSPGEVYFLDINEAGHITTGDPQAVGEAGQLRKVVTIGLSDNRAFITHYVGTVVFALNQDTINADSLVPVGSIFSISRETTPGSGWLKCDGKAYLASAYPDLSPEIQGRFYIDAELVSGDDAFEIFGTTTGVGDDGVRGFVEDMQLKLEYTKGDGSKGIQNCVVSSTTITSNGVRVNLNDFAGNPFPGNFMPGVDPTKLIEVYSRSNPGQFGNPTIIIPDLRARGVIGVGDPDGNGPENNMRPGEIANTFSQTPQFETSTVEFALFNVTPSDASSLQQPGDTNKIYTGDPARLTFVSISPPAIGEQYQMYLQTRENSNADWVTLSSQSVPPSNVGNVNGYIPASWSYRIIKTNIGNPSNIPVVITTL